MATAKSTNKDDDRSVTTIEDKPRGSNEVGGKLNLTENVVATIAGLAAREVEGVARMGRSRLISFGNSPTRGVGAEVGESEAAFDMEVIIKYGFDLRKVANELRSKVAEEVDKMAGRNVVEVNIDIVDIELPESQQPVAASKEPRVR